jgi:PAS domain S-box-containing protein
MGISQMTIPRIQTVEQMAQLQALLDSTGEGILGVDLEGNCTFANRAAANALGFHSEEMLGNSLHDLVHHHHPDARIYLYEECPIQEVLRSKKPYLRQEDTMFRKDGSHFSVEISAQPVMLEDRIVGAVVTFHEISELGYQQAALRTARDLADRQSAELNAVLEGIPHGVYLATRDAELRSNRRARAMSGEGFPSEFTTLDRALAGESSTETMWAADRWIRSVAEPIYFKGEILGGVVVNTDVTQVRMQDDALRKLEKLAAVGQLASSIAHEINNPLESITNLLYLIKQSESLEEIQQYAGIAQDELSRVTEITLQTLRFHRQNSKPAELDLANMLRALMALYAGRMLVRHIRTEMKFVEVPGVIALEGEIRQVLNNLVRNALDAMSAGGRLVIRLHPQQDWHTGLKGVRLTIADTGEGIRPEVAARLFEPFQTTKELTGTGLGLWVSKGIIEKHEGSIRTRTRVGEGHGTVFTVWLPVGGVISSTVPAS